jgi:predicted nucleic acid-binding protein
MKSYFAETSLFVAFLNPRDEYHESAVEYIRDESNFLVTTVWVLVELGNFVCNSRTRRRFAPFVRDRFRFWPSRSGWFALRQDRETRAESPDIVRSPRFWVNVESWRFRALWPSECI